MPFLDVSKSRNYGLTLNIALQLSDIASQLFSVQNVSLSGDLGIGSGGEGDISVNRVLVHNFSA